MSAKKSSQKRQNKSSRLATKQSGAKIHPTAFDKAFNKKRYQEALNIAEQLVEAKPNDPANWEALANVLGRLDRLVEAADAMEKAIQRMPVEDPKAILKFAQYALLAGRTEQAAHSLKNIIDQDPNHKVALTWLSRAYYAVGKNKEALENSEQALDIDENFVEALVWKSRAQDKLKRPSEAAATLKQIKRLEPKRVGVSNHLADISLREGDYETAEAYFKEELSIDPSNSQVLSNVYVARHYNPSYSQQDLSQLATEWQQQHAKSSPLGRAKTQSLPSKRLKVGLLSGGFRMHPVGQMILPALQHLEAKQFELLVYSTHQASDKLTDQIKAATHRWYNIAGLNPEELDQKIRDDQVDILIDMNGAGDGSRYLAISREPASLIVKWVGSLINTTGLSCMDYLISDSIETPAGVDELYTEKLIRMPDDYICYHIPEYAPKVTALPALKNGYITFGCLNNPAKLSPPLLEEWSVLLKEVPGSKLLLRGVQFEGEAFCEKITNIFASHGIESNRLILEGPADHHNFMATYQRIDIALDTWPYSGGLTTCEALLMGVPVVTHTGPTFAGRHTATHLANAGLPELITDNWNDFRRRAKELAGDLPNLAVIRAALRTILSESPVCDGPRFAKNLAVALRAIWQRHCEGKVPEALTLNKDSEAWFADEDKLVELVEVEVEPENAAFEWNLETPITVIDNGALFARHPRFAEWMQTGNFAVITFDPASLLTKQAEELKQLGEWHHYPHATLGDGKDTTLYATLDPELTGTLQPLPEQQTVEQNDPIRLLSSLPMSTVPLNAIEGLSGVDVLVLDGLNNATPILENGGDYLQHTLMIKASVVFQPTHCQQPNFSFLEKWAKKHEFRFYTLCDLLRKQNIFPPSSSDLNELLSAQVIFIPSIRRVEKLNSSEKKKLAYLMATILESNEDACKILNNISPELSLQYAGYINGEAINEKTKKRPVLSSVRDLMAYLEKAKLKRNQANHKLPGHLVVSLTSYKERFDNLYYTLCSLLLQSVTPDLLILWLSKDEEEEVPDSVLQLRNFGLSIRFCEDIRSYKKIIPALVEFPDSFIVTADDDIYYEPNWLKKLLMSWDGDNKKIVAHRAHKIRIDKKGNPLPYRQWKWEVGADEAADGLIFPTGSGGILYPPHVFHEDVTNTESFMRLSPKADDIWLYWMASLNGAKVNRSTYNFRLVEWPKENDSPLWRYNIQGGGNDKQIRNMLRAYPINWPKLTAGKNKNPVFSVPKYWDQRYKQGGNSGAGSYGRLAKFKADVINEFLEEKNVNSVIEFGCGDGNQLGLMAPVNYLGVDISPTAVKICQEKFSSQCDKKFLTLECFKKHPSIAELTMSLDVIYHLVDDDIFHDYMNRLFSSAARYCVIYSANVDEFTPSIHVRKRKFTDWVEKYANDWVIEKVIPNKYPMTPESDPNNTSFADFYIFRKSEGSKKNRRKVKDFDLIISGCGRSGTKAVSEFLSAVGYSVKHEAVFNGGNLLNRKSDFDFMNLGMQDSTLGESSWMTVPFIDFFCEETKIIFMLRDPLKVIKSFYEFGAMKYPSYSPSIRYAQSILPEICTDDELYNAAAYCMRWNDMAFMKLSKVENEILFFDIERSDVSRLENFMGLALGKFIETKNSRVKEKIKKVSTDDVYRLICAHSDLKSSYLRIEAIRDFHC